MSKAATPYRFLFAGGGTGGHLFPAIAVADQIRKIKPEAEILFVGTRNKIESRVVPSSGYKFKSIWISGLQRKNYLKNILFPVKLIVSMIQSLFISTKFKPSVAIGSGGYVAGPAVWGAKVLGAKIILLEQNGYPGITTRLLEKYAAEIHIFFKDAATYLRRKDRIKHTGNPVRESLGTMDKKSAREIFNLSERKTLLVIGGSLGAESINYALQKIVSGNDNLSFNIIWQAGAVYYNRYKSLERADVRVLKFIDDMNAAYSSADLVVARAGATTIAELITLGIPSVLIPSPNVSANHQYYNAKSLADESAAVLLEDKLLSSELSSIINSLINNDELLNKLSMNARMLSKPDAADVIARSAIKLTESI